MARIGAAWGDSVWATGVWASGVWEPASAPTLTNAIISYAGTTITVSFTDNVQFGAGGNGGFTLSLTGGACTMTYDSGSGTRNLVYTLSRTVAADETGTLDYTQPGDGVEDVNLTDVSSFSGATVKIGSEAQHTRIMRHTRLTMTHMESDITHNDPTLEHNE